MRLKKKKKGSMGCIQNIYFKSNLILKWKLQSASLANKVSYICSPNGPIKPIHSFTGIDETPQSCLPSVG